MQPQHDQHSETLSIRGPLHIEDLSPMLEDSDLRGAATAGGYRGHQLGNCEATPGASRALQPNSLSLTIAATLAPLRIPMQACREAFPSKWQSRHYPEPSPLDDTPFNSAATGPRLYLFTRRAT